MGGSVSRNWQLQTHNRYLYLFPTFPSSFPYLWALVFCVTSKRRKNKNVKIPIKLPRYLIPVFLGQIYRTVAPSRHDLQLCSLVFHSRLSIKRLNWGLSPHAWWVGMGRGGAYELAAYKVCILEISLGSDLCTCWELLYKKEPKETARKTISIFRPKHPFSCCWLPSPCCWEKKITFQLHYESRSLGVVDFRWRFLND